MRELSKSFWRRQNKKREFANDRYIKFFIENELSEEANNKKHKYVHSLYNNLSKDKKGKRRDYTHVFGRAWESFSGTCQIS